MSRRVEPARPGGPTLRRDPLSWPHLPLMIASALWATWRGRPSRRPVMVGIAVAPAVLVLLVLAMPGQTSRAVLEAASARPAAPPPVPRAGPPAPAVAGPGGAVDFSRRNPFGIRKNRVPDAPPVPTTPPPPPPSARPPPPPPPPMDTKLKLLGTFLMGDERWAVITVVATSKEDTYKEGDAPLPNSRITRIEPRKVQLLVDGNPGIIEIDYSDWGGKSKTTVAQAAPQPGPAYTPPPAESLQPVPQPPADGQPRRLARSEVDGYLDNLNTLLTQVNIQPVFQAGQPAGFRLTDIQKGTILDQIGVSDGDTLRFVNGQRIDSVQSAFQLYNILKESTNVEITVIRNTRPVTLRYLIY